MAAEWAGNFYSNTAWAKCKRSFRAKRISIDGGLCQDCHEVPGVIAHHWPVPLNSRNVNDPDIALNHDNLRWVCKECHDKYPGHGVEKSLTPKIFFDANGDPLPPSHIENDVALTHSHRSQALGECAGSRASPPT